MKHLQTSVVIAGAAPDTGNHGVTELCQSAVLGLENRGTHQFTILDNGDTARFNAPTGWNTSAGISRLGFKAGKRIYQSVNMHNIRLRQIFGLSSPVLTAIRGADALLDVSGGDSFTDLYGSARFEQIILPKLMAISCKTPLIMLPQTYGPFRSKRSRMVARRIVKASAMAFARDVDSFAYLKLLLGSDFDASKHRLGVDLAFGLPVSKDVDHVRNRPVGINVSGLLWNSTGAKDRFGLKADYQGTLVGLCKRLLGSCTRRLLLIPHVTPTGGLESDLDACRSLKTKLPSSLQQRIHIEETADSPSRLKAVIAKTSWFTGARMHATIAALSTATPVANMAYSGKARGVFDGCGVGREVFDLRQLSTNEMIEALVQAFDNRANQARFLKAQLPFVQRRWGFQMDAISGAIKTCAFRKEGLYA